MFKCRCVLLSVAIFAVATNVSAAPQAATKGGIPELTSSSFGWVAVGADWQDTPSGVRGPIQNDPEHPYHGNNAGPGQVTLRIGNYKDPALKSWAAAQMLKSNQEALSGERGIPFAAQSACYPGGVPGQLLFPAEPLYFIQTPKQVWMIWQRD